MNTKRRSTVLVVRVPGRCVLALSLSKGELYGLTGEEIRIVEGDV